MRERFHLETGEAESGAPHVVALEGVGIGVPGVALELDHKLGLRPVGVDVVPMDRDVPLIRRQTGRGDELEEGAFELRPRFSRGPRLVAEEPAHRRAAAGAAHALDRLPQLGVVNELEAFGLLEGALQVGVWQDGREVGKRPLG